MSGDHADRRHAGDAVTRLLDMIYASRASYLEIETDEFMIKAKKGGREKDIHTTGLTDSRHASISLVTSPAVGIVSLFARQGDQVLQGARIATVRMHDIVVDVAAPANGLITEIAVQPGAFVEYGQPLLGIHYHELS